MTDRYFAECMFGGSHADHNPRGDYWAVTDRERGHEENPTVIDYVTEAWAKRLASDLSMVDHGARTTRHAERSRRMKSRMAVDAQVKALGGKW